MKKPLKQPKQLLITLLVLGCTQAFLFCGNAQAALLTGNNYSYDINPATFSIEVVDDGVVWSVNKGRPSLDVTLLKQTKSQLSWYWPSLKTQVNIQLENSDLLIEFTSKQSQTLHWYTQPEQVEELILPLSEGMRVPVGNAQWRNYLSTSFGRVNTTYDFKIPFWSQINKNKTFSWLLLDPFYNQIDFSDTKQKVQLSAFHDFNRSNISQPFTILLHVGDDMLSGARRYRRYLSETKQLKLLVDKFKRVPNGRKVVGAIHAYLFGDALLDSKDVSDWQGLLSYLMNKNSDWLTRNFNDEAKKTLIKTNSGNLYDYDKKSLIDAINTALAAIKPVEAGAITNSIVKQQFSAAQAQKQLAIDNLAVFLVPPKNWGQGLSVPVIQQLRNAKLKNLWLGVNAWTAAFYHPEAVQLAKDYGYLIGPYDSYNTAIPVGVDETWLSAHLPDDMRKNCAVVLAGGKKQQGFGKKGYYLNPNCQQDFVHRRISDILTLGKFNSYFIDVDATGMVRDDFNPSNSTTEPEMRNAYNQRMRWITDSSSTVLGSEDGVSITQEGIIFAHGLETVGFGWQDQDMRKNRKSPFNLGRWYPSDKPEFFFKSAKVKEPYKTLLFSPEFRVPLYQAVFHDVVISSHHWTMDNLKFSDVKADRDLVGMLYNTPPMVNLSRDGIELRIKALQHYQEGYSPVHHVLWDKALVKFEYLTDNRKLQKTTFSDGSYIIANFNQEDKHVGRLVIKLKSVVAVLKSPRNGEVELKIRWQSAKL